MAWSSSSSSLLLTFAGEHSIRVYQKPGNDWQEVMLLGDPARRGCTDGPAEQLRFWFPTCEVPDGELICSRPLIAGPHGAVFVHSGGVLMRLSDCLSAACKVSSMREELWMVEDDEGTPHFPDSCRVFGVHDNKVYRSLLRTDFRGELLVRRLQISADLRKGRSEIRTAAPALWPGITETKTRDQDFNQNFTTLNVSVQALKKI